MVKAWSISVIAKEVWWYGDSIDMVGETRLSYTVMGAGHQRTTKPPAGDCRPTQIAMRGVWSTGHELLAYDKWYPAGSIVTNRADR